MLATMAGKSVGNANGGADLLQMWSKSPPPDGESAILLASVVDITMLLP
jgi:hypothetical protein